MLFPSLPWVCARQWADLLILGSGVSIGRLNHRDYLPRVCQASVSGNELCLMTSHLESTRGHAEERANQFRTVLGKMQEAPASATVIFGGDTNLRDHEVSDHSGAVLRAGGCRGSRFRSF